MASFIDFLKTNINIIKNCVVPTPPHAYSLLSTPPPPPVGG